MSRYPKPEVLTTLRPDHHAVIEASAGTGKTFLIEHLVVDLLVSDAASLDQILVVTFTEKATAELKARLRAILNRMLAADREETPPETEAWLLDAEARTRLERALYAFGTAPIFTIHAFCQRVLTEHAFNHRRLFTQAQIEAETAFAKAFTAALRSEFARVPEQQIWLRSWLGQHPLEALQQLLYRCYQTGAPIRPVFNAAALAECLGRLRQITGQNARFDAVLAEVDGARMHGGTKKALLERLQALAALVHGCDGEAALPALLTGVDRNGLAYLCDRLHGAKFVPSPGRPAHDLIEQLGALRRLCVPFPAAIVQTFLPAVRRRLQHEKQRQGWFDFDDMLSLVWQGLQGARGQALLETLRERYRYALIDEFQDTDPVQWPIFRRLFLDSARQNILYVIGDPKQAIYAFRGADIYTYLEARQEIQAADGTRVSLAANYRSTSAMLDALNGLFAQADTAPFFTGAIRYDAPVQCGDPDLLALDADGNAGAPIHLLQLVPPATYVSAALARHAFGRRIARIIRQLLQPAGALWLGHKDTLRPVTARDLFILTRSGREGVEIAQYLQAEGIPYAFYKQEGLFQTPEAQDICDLLMAIAAPHEQGKRFKAWTTAFFAVSLHELLAYQDLPSAHPLMQRLLTWKAWADRKDFATLFADILRTSGLVRRELFLKHSARELTNVQHIFEILLEEARRGHRTLSELIVSLKGLMRGSRSPLGEDGNVQRLASEHDAVQIMTMHKSKGLEAAVVFVYGGFARGSGERMVTYHEAGTRVLHIEPETVAREAARCEETEEEQRLLYVALTRAKARLYLPYIEPSSYPERFQGCHRRLNDRLAHVLTDPASAPVRPLLQLDPFTVEALDPQTSSTPCRVSLAAWQPPPAFFEADERTEEFHRRRQRHAAFVISSYSRMKQADGGYHRPDSTPEDLSRHDGLQTVPSLRDEADLPGGTMSGRFVHDVLEQLPLDSLTASPAFDTWRTRPDIDTLFSRTMRRYARDRRYLEASQRMVFAGFTTPITVANGSIIPGLAVCQPFRREMEFLYPIPEPTHPRLDDITPGPYPIENGYIKGFVDFCCRYDGLHYVGDWKTDMLPAYTPDVLEAHVQQNYTWQIKLYALALVKMLGIHSEADYHARFGGMLYCFLRGMHQARDGAAGVLFFCPTWPELLAYETELIQRQTYV